MSNEKSVPLTFIVNSGRCGSTMLSRILHNHPDVLSASEFMNTMASAMGGYLFANEQDVSGEDLWNGLRAPVPEVDAAILARSAGSAALAAMPSQVAYPYDSGRFRPEIGIPRICHFVLPMLSDDPDGLFDQLAAEVPSWPARKVADQYRALLAYLAGLLGRRVAIERSGGASGMAAPLAAHYPDARFVHLHRDGPDCALSLSRFPAARTLVLAALATEAAELPPKATWSEILAAVPEEFKGLLATPRDWDRFAAYPIPVTHFGNLWTWRITEVANALNELPRESWTSLKYEELVDDPSAELTRLAEFIAVPATAQWLDKACEMVKRDRTGTAAAQLDPETLDALRDACEPGEKIIAALEAGDAMPPAAAQANAAPEEG
jgi:hypothetical protein